MAIVSQWYISVTLLTFCTFAHSFYNLFILVEIYKPY